MGRLAVVDGDLTKPRLASGPEHSEELERGYRDYPLPLRKHALGLAIEEARATKPYGTSNVP
jgi:hypothetical protein